MDIEIYTDIQTSVYTHIHTLYTTTLPSGYFAIWKKEENKKIMVNKKKKKRDQRLNSFFCLKAYHQYVFLL